MKQLRGAIAFISLLLFFSAFVLQSLHRDLLAASTPTQSISVILYGESADRWAPLEQGIRQACLELGIQKPAVTIAGPEDSLGQLHYLQRDVDNGAQGLLVAAESTSLAAYLEELKIPVVALETGAGSNIPCVSANDAAMARSLAQLYAGKGKTVALLAENLHRQNILDRYNAFITRSFELGQPVLVLKREDSGMDIEQFIRFSARAHRPDVLVVLDNDTLETAARVLASARNIEIGGMGNSAAVVHALDDKILDALCFSDEYAIGYISTMTLAAEMGLIKKLEPVEIHYGIARHDNMYRPEKERLLFPATH